MNDYLVMRLYGPLASWGDVAVGEARHTALHPSRSALLGLLGAALGIVRDDEDGQAALAAGYRFAVKLVAEGSPLRDYHTVQAPAQQRKVRFLTRRAELFGDKQPGTLLSSRDYRCDSIAIVAVQAQASAPFTLAHLAAALKTPVFPLYLGRKACTPAVPVHPQLVACETLKQALDDTPQYTLAGLSSAKDDNTWPGYRDNRMFRQAASRYYWEEGMAEGLNHSFHVERHDQPLSRRRWQFQSRTEYVLLEEDHS